MLFFAVGGTIDALGVVVVCESSRESVCVCASYKYYTFDVYNVLISNHNYCFNQE